MSIPGRKRASGGDAKRVRRPPIHLRVLRPPSGFVFHDSDFEFRVSGFGFRDSGFGFRVLGFGFRVSAFGFRVPRTQCVNSRIVGKPEQGRAYLTTCMA